MGRRRRMIDTSVSEEDEGEHPSRGDARAARRALQDRLEAAGARLAALPPQALAKLDLGEDVEEAIRTLATLSSHGALPRQRRRVARLLREHDIDELERSVEYAEGATGPRDSKTHRLERLRDALLDEGSDALERLFDAHVDLDRPRVHQAVRAARREAKKAPDGPRPKYRALFQLLKELGLGAAPEENSEEEGTEPS